MSLLITILVSPFIAYVLRKPLQQWPPVFYGIAVVTCATGIYLALAPVPQALLRAFSAYLQHGAIAIALFILVMFIGVLPDGSKIRQAFTLIRAELSILASIFICGHFIPYLFNYLGTFSNLMVLKNNVLMSLAISLVLLILLIVLTLTSFKAIKRRMNTELWKRLQRLSYIFFGLIYLHLLGYLLPPAASGALATQFTLGVYTVLFLAYLILRINKARQAKRER